MKIDGTHTSFTGLIQPKGTRTGRADEKNFEQNEPGDTVELVSQEPSPGAAAVSHSQAMDTARSIDYRKAFGAHIISEDISTQLLSLLARPSSLPGI